MTTPRDILTFWFAPNARHLWFEKDKSFDDEIRLRFAVAVHEAQMGGLDSWQQSPEGALALLLLLDQFSRNIYRDAAKAFLGDQRARDIAERAIAKGFDRQSSFQQQRFFYLPFEHGESLTDQRRAVELFSPAIEVPGPADPEDANEQPDYAHQPPGNIARVCRFPQCDAVLWRDSTP